MEQNNLLIACASTSSNTSSQSFNCTCFTFFTSLIIQKATMETPGSISTFDLYKTQSRPRQPPPVGTSSQLHETPTSIWEDNDESQVPTFETGHNGEPSVSRELVDVQPNDSRLFAMFTANNDLTTHLLSFMKALSLKSSYLSDSLRVSQRRISYAITLARPQIDSI